MSKRRLSARAAPPESSSEPTEEVLLETPSKRRRLRRHFLEVEVEREEEEDVEEEEEKVEKQWRPKDFDKAYAAIQHQRKTGEVAPVDTMGCHQLGRKEVETPTVFRFTTLVSLMLSSQTKDEQTAKAVWTLQKHFQDSGGLSIENMARLSETEIRDLIYGVGFHNRKANYLHRTANLLLETGDIPDTLEGLLALPGVGPKMAYLALQVAWDRTEGIGVDVHVHRLSNRLGWVKKPTKNPEQTRIALQSWLPREEWGRINSILVGFGQTVCTPRNPRCDECDARQWCPTGRRSPGYRKWLAEQKKKKKEKASAADEGEEEEEAVE